MNYKAVFSYRNCSFLIVFSAVFIACLLSSSKAQAETHAFIQSMRSGSVTHLLISQSVDGEFGKFDTLADSYTSPEGITYAPYQESRYWQGFNFRTSFGIELMKFIQFSAGHTFVNLRQKSNALENLRGSRLHGEFGLVFSSPIGNLEAGLGLIGSKLDYQKQLESATFYGNGTYYSLGVNYFLSSRVSVFGQIKIQEEHLVKNGGVSSVKSIDSNTSGAGLGFRIWM